MIALRHRPLYSQNLQGGSVPQVTYLGSQGNNYAYNSVTFAENEERSPWEPFHVQHGFKREQSVVSVFSGCVAVTSSMLAIDPPPAPISIMSMTGALIGRPEPRLKR